MSFVNVRLFFLGISLTSRLVVLNIQSAEAPPLEGPVIAVAISVTDQRQDEFTWTATDQVGRSGAALPGATKSVILGLLDSGSGTHLVSYPDALAMGIQGTFLSEDTFQVSGVDEVDVDLDISMPTGYFVQGLQDLDNNGNPQPSLMFGQGNFAAGVNSFANFESGIKTPTVIGAPFFISFPVYIRNSQPVQASALGNGISSPSVTFYDGPLDPQIPVLAHKIFLETRPTGPTDVTYLPDVNDDLDFFPGSPSAILSGSLFFTASSMTFHQGVNTTSGKMVVDTGAQATLISEIAAAELDLDLQNPDFEIEVQGLAETIIAPGFYVDSASIPAGGGAVSWTNVPVVVLNVASPEGGTLFGIFGSNLTAKRDIVFNGAASTPYLSVTEPIVSPRIKISAIRPTGPGSAEVDWHAEPAPPVLYLEVCTNLASNPPEWMPVATNDLSTINGTLTVTGLGPNSFFRLQAP